MSETPLVQVQPKLQMTGRVLVADDEPLMRQLVGDMLRAFGLTVTLVDNGADALAQAEAQAFDLIILDVMMPKKDGFEVCRRVKERARVEGRFQPVMMLTAMGHREARLEGLALGADDYLTKPFSMNELMLRVRSLLETRRVFHDLQRRTDEVSRIGENQRRLAHFMVHDLKNPLAGLDASLQLLERYGSANLDERARTYLEDALDCSKRLFGLVNTVLDVYRMEEGGLPLKRAIVTARAMLDGAADTYATFAALKEITLQVVAPEASVAVDADASLIDRVFGNLITNAVRYTPRGRVIELGARATEGHQVQLWVEDQAPRIAAEHREHIFSRFGRVEAKGQTPGHGLGLTFCRLAVEAHGGTIAVEDGSIGNRFTFTLPAPT